MTPMKINHKAASLRFRHFRSVFSILLQNEGVIFLVFEFHCFTFKIPSLHWIIKLDEAIWFHLWAFPFYLQMEKEIHSNVKNAP